MWSLRPKAKPTETVNYIQLETNRKIKGFFSAIVLMKVCALTVRHLNLAPVRR
jgi:hypothetical protein